MGYSPWSLKELDTAEHTHTTHSRQKIVKPWNPVCEATFWQQECSHDKHRASWACWRVTAPESAFKVLRMYRNKYDVAINLDWNISECSSGMEFHLQQYCVPTVVKTWSALCYPMGCSPSGPSVHGIFQGKMLEWVVISSSRISSKSRDLTHISCIGRWIIYHWATWEVI